MRALLVEAADAGGGLSAALSSHPARVGIEVTRAENVQGALARVASSPFDVVVLVLGSEDDAADAVSRLRAELPALPLVVVAGDAAQVTAAGSVGGEPPDVLTRGELTPASLLACLRLAVKNAATERRLAADKRSHHSVLDDAVVGFFQSTPDGRYRTANPALARMYGYENPAELMSAVSDITTQLYVDPQRRTELRRLLEEGGSVSRFEHEVNVRDGSTRWVSVSARAVRSPAGAVEYFEGTVEDITDRRRAEEELRQAHEELERRVEERTRELAGANARLQSEVRERRVVEAALRESEERFRALTESSADVIMRFDRACRHVYVNSAVEAQTGIQASDFMGKTHRELSFPDELCELWESAIRTVLATGTLRRVEFELPSHVWIDWLLMPELAADGSVRFVMTAARDITDRKRAETALEQARSELEARVAERTLALARSNEALQAEIAERIAAEEALRESEEAVRALLNAPTDVALLIDRNGEIREANAQAARSLGRPIAELLGARAFDLIGGATRLARKARFDEVLATGRPVRFEDMRAGVAYDNSMFPVFDAQGRVSRVALIARDVSEARKAEEARLRLATAVEQAAESIIITDIDGRIEYVNPAFCRTTGHTRDEAIGQNIRMVESGLHSDAFYRELWQTLGRGEVWTGRFTNRHKDGSLFQEDSTISPIRGSDGRIVNYVAVQRDVTREVALAEQLRESQKMRAIGQLAGGVAHDFNNLLQAFLGTIEVLRARHGDPHALSRTVAELEADVRRGTSLTRQLLMFAREEVVKVERLPLNDAILETGALLRRLVRENIQFNLDLAPDELYVDVDRGQLEQVLSNLVLNAADAMPDGGELAIRTGTLDATAWLEVSDTGTGIPDEIRTRIFEPFFTTKGAGKGTGLGLSVVHGVVAGHGGRIEVESEPGRGSTFRVILPAKDPPDPVPSRALGVEGELPSGKGERVLIVEDEAGARESLHEMLDILGYSPLAVASGEEAASLPVAPAFDVLLTDLVLPGIHGRVVAERMSQRWPHLRVIMMSGYAADVAVREGVIAGTIRFLEKPFDMTALATAIRDVLEQPQPRGDTDP